MTPFRYTISLRLRHPTMPASTIADALAMAAKASWSVVDQRTDRAGAALIGIQLESYCCFFLAKGSDGKLAQALVKAAAGLERHREFFRSFRETQGRIELYVGWFFGHGRVAPVGR